MNLIVAVDSKHGIGRKGKLLFHLPDDLKFFKLMTVGKTVVMGYNTYMSIPNAPLKDRKNVVLTTKRLAPEKGVVYVNSVEQLLDEVKGEEVFVIGGQSVYNQLCDLCDTAYVTEIDADGGADTFFSKVYEGGWKRVSESEPQNYKGISYKFCIFEK